MTKQNRLLRRDMPLTSYDSRYYDIIIEGTKREIEIPQQSRKDANRLRHLLTTYRARYKRHYEALGDARWEVLYNTTIGISDDGLATRLRPKSQEADHLLKNVTFTDLTSERESDVRSSSLIGDPLAEFLENDK